MAELFVVVVVVVLFWGALKVLAKATNIVVKDVATVAVSHSSAFRRESSGSNYASLPTAVRRAGYDPEKMEIHEMMQVLDTISELDMSVSEEEVLTVLKKLSKFSKYKTVVTPTPTPTPTPNP